MHTIAHPFHARFTVAFCLAAAAPALARPNIREAFFSAYPDTVGSRLDLILGAAHCGVCHYDFNGGGMRNPYGQRVETALPNFPNNPSGRRQAVLSVQDLDPDGDGFSTLIEVADLINFMNTPTFPGLTPANVGNVSHVNVQEIQYYLVPSVGGDITPPEIELIAPDGGEVLVANRPTTVLWSASDPSGVAAIDLFASFDDRATFLPVALGLSNSGSYVWHPANRPTTRAWFRVYATDNAFNRGYEESESAFTVAAPPGGLAPTTLRDFDMPGSQPFEAGTLNDTAACATCHGNYDTAVEPLFNWRGSMMAHASIDPLFEACMAVANQDAPDSGDVCLRCHIPKGWLAGRSVPTDGSRMLDTDLIGVSCDLCHRLVDPVYAPENPGEDVAILNALSNPPSNFANGMIVVDPTGARRGPFVDAVSGHPILVSPFHREAALCGSCHDVSNPAFEKDGQGKYVPNAFDQPAASFSSHTLLPIERTYSEWFYSDYNTPGGVYAPQFGGNRDFVATCQDCHLRDVTGKGCNLVQAPLRNDLPLHDMTGGSAWLVSLLPQLYPGRVDPLAAAAGADRARYMLANAAELAAEQDGGSLLVRVTNNSGHKLPTGYPEGRRMWLNVRFLDANGELIAESGAYDSNTGQLLHDPAVKVYEAKPGLDEITAPLVGVPPGPSFHFVLNNRIYQDNRIPPRGFENAAYAQFGGAPVGHAYADGQYWDTTPYAIPAQAASVEVRLYYQSTSKEYVEFLRDENTTNNAGQFLHDTWAANGRCPPEEMAVVAMPLIGPMVGDLNCDGALDAFDIEPFILALLDPIGYAAAYPDCDRNLADVNGDGAVDAFDIEPFVALLVGP